MKINFLPQNSNEEHMQIESFRERIAGVVFTATERLSLSGTIFLLASIETSAAGMLGDLVELHPTLESIIDAARVLTKEASDKHMEVLYGGDTNSEHTASDKLISPEDKCGRRDPKP